MNTAGIALCCVGILLAGIILGWMFRVLYWRHVMQVAAEHNVAHNNPKWDPEVIREHKVAWDIETMTPEELKTGKVTPKVSCPLPNCHITKPHSHAEALIRKMKGN